MADPVWEWRTFGDSFGDIESRVQRQVPPLQESSELYVVSDHSSINTKIRGPWLEVTTIGQTDEHGLEQWQPFLREQFPLGPQPLEKIYGAWGITPAPLNGGSCTLAAFLDDVLRKDRSLELISVTKKRRSCVIDGCLVELVDVAFDGVPHRTIGIEAADPAVVWDAVGVFGFPKRENVCYVKALQRFIAMRDRVA